MKNIAYINWLPNREYERMVDCHRFEYDGANAIRLYYVTNENEIQEIIEMGVKEIKDREDDLEDTTKRREMKVNEIKKAVLVCERLDKIIEMK